MERLRAVEDAFRATCRAWGYREIRTPVIEPLHLFTSAGTLSPQTLDRVYSFLDWDGWSGERVVLRPDSTIPAARLYAEHLRGDGIAKLCYSQDVFRFTDDGSSREEWQCGVELIGDTGVRGDVELVLLALEVLKPLGLRDITVSLSRRSASSEASSRRPASARKSRPRRTTVCSMATPLLSMRSRRGCRSSTRRCGCCSRSKAPGAAISRTCAARSSTPSHRSRPRSTTWRSSPPRSRRAASPRASRRCWRGASSTTRGSCCASIQAESASSPEGATTS